MFFNEYTDEKFLLAFALVLLMNIILALLFVRRVLLKKQVLKYLSLVNLPLVFVVGAYIGTFYSHGIDIPWPLHGLVATLPGFLIGCVVVGIVPRTWLKTN
jgi:hypothetical protein